MTEFVLAFCGRERGGGLRMKLEDVDAERGGGGGGGKGRKWTRREERRVM